MKTRMLLMSISILKITSAGSRRLRTSTPRWATVNAGYFNLYSYYTVQGNEFWRCDEELGSFLDRREVVAAAGCVLLQSGVCAGDHAECVGDFCQIFSTYN